MESSTLLLALLITTLSIIPAFIFSTDLNRWLRKKFYQYELTTSLYMMTPSERFLINSIVFLLLSMLIIAATLYLPEHAMTMSQRAFYYWTGKTPPASLSPASAALGVVQKVASSVVGSGAASSVPMGGSLGGAGDAAGVGGLA